MSYFDHHIEIKRKVAEHKAKFVMVGRRDEGGRLISVSEHPRGVPLPDGLEVVGWE